MAFEFPGHGEGLLGLWQKSQRMPMGKNIFSRVLGWAIPYTGSISPVVESVEAGSAVVTMKDTRTVRNHLSSVHAIALANIGEFSTGLALISQLPKGMRAILGSIKVDYLKKSRGLLTARAKCEPVAFGENFNRKVISEIFNTDNVCVARVEATWVVGPDKKRGA